jgi:dihydroorotate dehydrogenase
MPDWTYQPIFKPLFFRLPSRTARDVMLAAVGNLANMPFGTRILDFMGHMHPHGSLAVNEAGIEWPTRVGIGAELAFTDGTILAFSHFGVGHIEVGPVTVSPVVSTENIIRDPQALSISYSDVPENQGLEKISAALKVAIVKIQKEKHAGGAVQIGARVSNTPGCNIETATIELQQLTKTLGEYSSFITLDTRWWSQLWNISETTRLVKTSREETEKKKIPLFILVPPDCSDEFFNRVLKWEHAGLIQGFVVGGGILTNDEESQTSNSVGRRRVHGRPAKKQTLAMVKRLSAAMPVFLPDSDSQSSDKADSAQPPTIVASGGIIEPQDALDLLDAGASLLQIHSGFVFSGPGLPKRINECISYYKPLNPGTAIGATATTPYNHPEAKTPKGISTEGWIGFTLVAIGLIISSSTVIAVGLTRVLLPYDEAFLGVTMTEIPKINENLLKFMSHDRVTLGGSSLSGAVLFFGLAVFGIRRQHHWAYHAEVAGLIAGFLAFFLYLGFKYFDPLHALVCLLVLPFFIWGVVKKPEFAPERSPNLTNDKNWQRSQIGQLLFVAIGAGLLLAGVTIAGVGCSAIFVNEDLMFMHTSRCTLESVNPRLLPLIAHDRASFGGCLWAVGTVEMLTSLYGFRQGCRWVWWMLLLAGLPGFIAVMGIHLGIGYTSFVHLLPAYIAVCMFIAGLYLSYGYLCGSSKTVA